jgi:hypothetical protein
MDSNTKIAQEIAHDQAREEALVRFERAIQTSEAFRIAWQSHAGRRASYGPVPSELWAHAIETLARFARHSDVYAQLVRSVLSQLPLYQSKEELCAALWRSAFEALKQDYDDVVGRAAPDAGRPSSYQRDWTMKERIEFYAACQRACGPMAGTAPGYGWALVELAKKHCNYLLPEWK